MSDHVLKRGLKDIYAAEILHDDNETNTAGQGETPNHGYVTGTPFHLIPAGTMSRAVSSEKKDTYFDNTVFDTVGKEDATTVKIDGAALRPDALARINNKYVDSTTGAVIDSGDFAPKYFALGGIAENTDGTTEMFWFAKGTFAIPEQSDKTKDDTTDTNGMSLEFSAIKTAHLFSYNSGNHPLKRFVIDTDTTVLKTSQSWTAQVVTPENMATVIQRKSS